MGGARGVVVIVCAVWDAVWLEARRSEGSVHKGCQISPYRWMCQKSEPWGVHCKSVERRHVSGAVVLVPLYVAGLDRCSWGGWGMQHARERWEGKRPRCVAHIYGFIVGMPRVPCCCIEKCAVHLVFYYASVLCTLCRKQVRDFRLPPRRMLHGVDLCLFTDVLGQPVGPIFKGHAVKNTWRPKHCAFFCHSQGEGENATYMSRSVFWKHFSGVHTPVGSSDVLG
jgi:hypothetical protein